MSTPDPDKKPRKDSILDSQLSEDQKEELRRMLMTGFGQDECMEWLRTTCGVVIKSGYTLTKFWQRHCLPLVDDRRKFAAAKAEGYIKKSGRTKWNAATKELVSQTTFEILSGQAVDPKVAERFIKLVLKAEKQDQDAEKIAILKRKAEQIDNAKDVLKEKLNPEEENRRLREILK